MTKARWQLCVMRALVCVVVLFSSFNDVATAETDPARLDRKAQASIDAAIAQCDLLLKVGEWKQAAEIAAKLQGLKTPSVDALIGKIALAGDAIDVAWKRISGYATKGTAVAPENVAAHLVAGNVLIARGEFQAAVDLFDWIATSTAGESQVLAAEGCGLAFVGLGKWRLAIESLEFAIAQGRAKLYNNAKEYDWLFDRMTRELADANRKQEIDLYGEDFIFYRDGETARRLSLSYEQAIASYAKVLSRHSAGPYADASDIYQAICHEELGKSDEAEKQLKIFIAKNASGPYRGEALLTLARIAIDRRIDFHRGLELCSQLDQWIENARGRPMTAPVGVKVETAPFIQPPTFQFRKTKWGFVERVPINPGQLINETTSSWYLDALAASCAKLRGFMAFAMGNPKEAEVQYARLKMLDPECAADGPGAKSDFSRLTWGLKHGYLYATPMELSLYSERQRFAILLADFHYITQDFASSRSIFQRLLNDEFGSLPPAKREYPQLGFASCTYWVENAERAIAEYMKILSPGRGSITRARAMYSIANLATGSKDEKTVAIGNGILNDLVRQEPTSDWHWMGRILSCRLRLKAGMKAEAIAALKSFPRSAGAFKELADYLASEAQH